MFLTLMLTTQISRFLFCYSSSSSSSSFCFFFSVTGSLKLKTIMYYIIFVICLFFFICFFASACCCWACIKVIIIVYSKDMSTCWSLALAYALCLCATSWAISLSWFGICIHASAFFFSLLFCLAAR